MTVHLVNQRRADGIGASLAAACLGVSPYLSPIGAWLQLRGMAKATPGGAAAEWGQIIEPVIRGYYAAKHGHDKPGVSEIVVPTESVIHPEHAWLHATPDGIVREWFDGQPIDLRGLECKTVDSRIAWQWGLDRRVRTPPPHYRIQAVIQMACTSLPRVDFAALFGGNDYAECIVERDLDLEATACERLAVFWASLDAEDPPAIDGADEWRDYFADRLPAVKSRALAHRSVENLLDEWKRLRDAIDVATKDEATVKNQILAAAVDARANVLDSDHGPVLVVMPKGKRPYLKAPIAWGIDKE